MAAALTTVNCGSFKSPPASSSASLGFRSADKATKITQARNSLDQAPSESPELILPVATLWGAQAQALGDVWGTASSSPSLMPSSLDGGLEAREDESRFLALYMSSLISLAAPGQHVGRNQRDHGSKFQPSLGCPKLRLGP